MEVIEMNTFINIYIYILHMWHFIYLEWFMPCHMPFEVYLFYDLLDGMTSGILKFDISSNIYI